MGKGSARPLVALAVLLGTATLALLVMTPTPPIAVPGQTRSARIPAPEQAAAAESHTFVVALAGGRVQSGDDTLKVRQGEQVEVRVSSDQPVALHLHGYEVQARVTPQQAAVMAFKADLPGRFPVHEHREGAGNHRAVLFIEVHP